MLSKLVLAYEEKCINKKTLIFNNGINTSLIVYDTFKNAGFDVKHLDNTATKKERARQLHEAAQSRTNVVTYCDLARSQFL